MSGRYRRTKYLVPKVIEETTNVSKAYLLLVDAVVEGGKCIRSQGCRVRPSL